MAATIVYPVLEDIGANSLDAGEACLGPTD